MSATVCPRGCGDARDFDSRLLRYYFGPDAVGVEDRCPGCVAAARACLAERDALERLLDEAELEQARGIERSL